MDPASDIRGSAKGGAFAVLQRIADGIAVVATYLAALCLALLVAMVLAEVLLALLSRVFPKLPSGIGVAWEYSAYMMGISFLLGSGLTLRAGMHIRVELLLRSAGGRHARLYEFISGLIGAVFTVLFAWSLVAFTIQSYRSGQVSGDSLTPLWIPQAALAAGAIILALEMCVRLLAVIQREPLEDRSFGVATLPE